MEPDWRQLVPGHVTGEGIIHRDAVEQDERAPGAARAKVPQGHALGGGIRDPAAAPPEEAEAGDIRAENVIEPQLRRIAEFLFA